MSRKYVSRYCPSCEARVLAIPQKKDYSLHALLLILTCGLWLVPATLIESFRQPYVCRYCGKSV